MSFVCFKLKFNNYKTSIIVFNNFLFFYQPTKRTLFYSRKSHITLHIYLFTLLVGICLIFKIIFLRNLKINSYFIGFSQNLKLLFIQDNYSFLCLLKVWSVFVIVRYYNSFLRISDINYLDFQIKSRLFTICMVYVCFGSMAGVKKNGY